jgi:hypothetical protein
MPKKISRQNRKKNSNSIFSNILVKLLIIIFADSDSAHSISLFWPHFIEIKRNKIKRLKQENTKTHLRTR